MQIRGGNYSNKGGMKRCDSLIAQSDGSLLMKSGGAVCLDYKMDLAKDVTGKVTTSCRHATVEGKKIMCTKS